MAEITKNEDYLFYTINQSWLDYQKTIQDEKDKLIILKHLNVVVSKHFEGHFKIKIDQIRYDYFDDSKRYTKSIYYEVIDDKTLQQLKRKLIHSINDNHDRMNKINGNDILLNEIKKEFSNIINTNKNSLRILKILESYIEKYSNNSWCFRENIPLEFTQYYNKKDQWYY